MLKRIVCPLAVSMLILVLSGFLCAQGEKKIAYGILIDNTRSLETQFPQVKALAKGVVRRINQHGSVSIFSFVAQSNKRDPPAVITSGFESNQEKSLEGYIDNLRVEPGQTTLMDAIYSIAEKLNVKANLDKETFADKTIILVTDGEDRISKVKEKQLIKELRENGIKVYAVGLIQALDDEGGLIRKSPRATATEFLKKIAKETGGRVIFPKSKQIDLDTLLSELLTK
jgi:hypothetical protein